VLPYLSGSRSTVRTPWLRNAKGKKNSLEDKSLSLGAVFSRLLQETRLSIAKQLCEGGLSDLDDLVGERGCPGEADIEA